MNFITYNELSRDILSWEIPRDYDIVVGVPRSGMIPAAMLALHWNVRLATVDSLASGSVLEGGLRDQHTKRERILLVDDSLLSGKSMIAACKKLASYTLDTAAVYTVPEKVKFTTFTRRVLPLPRIFQWNWAHHYWLQHACVDIDGVLCEDPTPSEDDDGEKYVEFILNATPKYLPTVEIGALVTNRLEAYRRPTERWLARHGVSYKQLIMHPAKTKKERMAMGDHSLHKSRAYSDRTFRLFVESSKRQAFEINQISGKPVLCTDTMRMYV